MLWLAPILVDAGVTVQPRRADLRAVLTDPYLNLDPGTIISFPDSNPDEYFKATERWSIYQAPTYSAAVTPATEEDVATIIRLSRQHNFNFLATGSRHGYNRHLDDLNEGVALDLSALNTIIVDREARQLTAGAGVILRDLYGPLSDAGLQIQTGVCGCTGLIGVTVGSGVGRLQGIYGLIADALLSVRMITAEGDMVEASREVNSELFWGIRGAGANLGVIVSATYEVYPMYRGGQFTVLDFVFEGKHNQTYFDLLASYMGPGQDLPAEISASTVLFWNVTHQTAQFMANWAYAGPEEEAQEVLAELLDIPAVTTRIVQVPWRNLTATAVFGLDPLICAPNRPITIMGINLRNVYSNVLQELMDRMVVYWKMFPDAVLSTVTIESFPNQATMAYPADSSAYPWRDAKTYIMLQPMFGGPSAPVAMAYLCGVRAQLAVASDYEEYAGLSVYVNYSQGDESLEQIYGARNLPRLAALKAKYDPDNVFRFNNPIPTSYP
ncbi:hypothetical protein B0I35DRAFT_365798 [Stachybotrys elegans]|uniref:FAD-binding PCMH-type domain-containing protein n=1 Tax=Stachybotrys elegans TaxID=80388 RepID=A0A8K0WK34_9HYPO|nr:hypothetical protein B0I35DRAFT_365798 [Stachybotrys elegans]